MVGEQDSGIGLESGNSRCGIFRVTEGITKVEKIRESRAISPQ